MDHAWCLFYLYFHDGYDNSIGEDTEYDDVDDVLKVFVAIIERLMVQI